LDPQGNKYLLAAGVLLVVGAIIVDALAYGSHARASQKAASPSPAPSRGKKNAERKTATKGLIVSLVSGILMGSFYPLVQMGVGGGPDNAGLGPYAVAFWFAIGVFVSTFIFNLYFLNLPVEGEPISMSFYLRGTARQHVLGIVGGLIWCTGAIANFVAASTPKQVQVGPAISYAIGQGATMISALWGLLVWKEFAGANSRVKTMLAIMLLLFVAGLALVSLAPIYAD
jgi:glucose uptake protein